jgi:uncharacterized protein with HEPN domain
MAKDTLKYLDDMLECIEIIEQHVSGQDLDSFTGNVLMQDAVLRRFTIIGEACRRITEEYKENHPEIPWYKIKAMRNFVIHEYDKVSTKTIWKTVTDDLPPLKKQLQEIMKCS